MRILLVYKNYQIQESYFSNCASYYKLLNKEKVLFISGSCRELARVLYVIRKRDQEKEAAQKVAAFRIASNKLGIRASKLSPSFIISLRENQTAEAK